MSRKSKTKQKTDVKVPAHLEALLQQGTSQARSAFDGVFDAYTGDRFADFSGDELLAQGGLRDLVSPENMSSLGDVYANGLSRLTGDLTAEDLAPFMNLYDDEVTDYAVRDLTEDAEIAQNRLRRQMDQSGAGNAKPIPGRHVHAEERLLELLDGVLSD